MPGLIYLDAAHIYAFYDQTQPLDGELLLSQSALAEMPKSETKNPGNIITAGIRMYTDIKVPAFAICAIPDQYAEQRNREAGAFEKGAPGSKIVIVRNADHALFLPNEEGVLREMKTFMAGLP